MCLHRPLLTSTTNLIRKRTGWTTAYARFYCDGDHKLSDRCHLFYVIVDTTYPVALLGCRKTDPQLAGAIRQNNAMPCLESASLIQSLRRSMMKIGIVFPQTEFGVEAGYDPLAIRDYAQAAQSSPSFRQIKDGGEEGQGVA